MLQLELDRINDLTVNEDLRQKSTINSSGKKFDDKLAAVLSNHKLQLEDKLIEQMDSFYTPIFEFPESDKK